MIDMRMGDEEKIQARRIIGSDVPVAFFNGIGALVHAAVDGKAGLLRFNDVTGARDGPRRPEKFNFHEQSFCRVFTDVRRRAFAGTAGRLPACQRQSMASLFFCRFFQFFGFFLFLGGLGRFFVVVFDLVVGF
jgi:hypothetical protein